LIHPLSFSPSGGKEIYENINEFSPPRERSRFSRRGGRSYKIDI
jgi:hypothetical protein